MCCKIWISPKQADCFYPAAVLPQHLTGKGNSSSPWSSFCPSLNLGALASVGEEREQSLCLEMGWDLMAKWSMQGLPWMGRILDQP